MTGQAQQSPRADDQDRLPPISRPGGSVLSSSPAALPWGAWLLGAATADGRPSPPRRGPRAPRPPSQLARQTLPEEVVPRLLRKHENPAHRTDLLLFLSFVRGVWSLENAAHLPATSQGTGGRLPLLREGLAAAVDTMSPGVWAASRQRAPCPLKSCLRPFPQQSATLLSSPGRAPPLIPLSPSRGRLTVDIWSVPNLKGMWLVFLLYDRCLSLKDNPDQGEKHPLDQGSRTPGRRRAASEAAFPLRPQRLPQRLPSAAPPPQLRLGPSVRRWVLTGASVPEAAEFGDRCLRFLIY